ncbi:hypothetical protein C8R44DRAFT_976320 [Mycena epipterygia]|nr:hypothetical protein C8R44DRAFT_976320 [Mycena epipterygia]
MFFIILVFYLSRNSSLVQGLTLDPQGPSDSCDDIHSCRTLFDIVWGCLTTIFACTWVSVHQNIPPPDQGWLSLHLRKLRMMLVTIIAPELVVIFAARQLLAALYISKEFNVSKTHGFFFCMGGFVSRNGHHPIVTMVQLRDPVLGGDYILAIQKVKEVEITEKSKGDALSKGVALSQGLWFATQCLARATQHLPVTEIEVATLAFAVINIFIWALWWWKPLDVERPIVVGPGPELQDSEDERRITLWEEVNAAASWIYPSYSPLSSISVPSFYCTNEKAVIQDTKRFALVATGCGVGAIFGGIHCSTWNAVFPSAVEMWMWRCSSLFITAVPPWIVCITALTVVLDLHEKSWERSLKDFPRIRIALGLISDLPFFLYPIARLFLVILVFTTLRALPARAFVDVDWSVYIPHL